MPYLHSNIYRNISRIIAEDYHTATFKGLRIVNQHLKYYINGQLYKNLITKFEEQNIFTAEMCTNRDTLMVMTLEDPKDSTIL